ncbi:hypothetical protein AC579_10110, partial [Pseudocercospora musae]
RRGSSEEDSEDGSDDDDDEEEDDDDDDDDEDDDCIRPCATQTPYTIQKYGQDAIRASQKSAKEGRTFALSSIPLLRSMMSGGLNGDSQDKGR